MKKIKDDLDIVVYSTHTCPYCDEAMKLFSAEGIPDSLVNKLYVDESPELRDKMLELSGGARTVPQIFINGKHIGGYTDLVACKGAGDLEALLFD